MPVCELAQPLHGQYCKQWYKERKDILVPYACLSSFYNNGCHNIAVLPQVIQDPATFPLKMKCNYPPRGHRQDCDLLKPKMMCQK